MWCLLVSSTVLLAAVGRNVPICVSPTWHASFRARPSGLVTGPHRNKDMPGARLCQTTPQVGTLASQGYGTVNTPSPETCVLTPLSLVQTFRKLAPLAVYSLYGCIL